MGFAGLLAGIVLTGVVSAQDITRFKNGYLTFTNKNPAIFYRVEFKPNLMDPVDWDGTNKSLRNIQSSESEVTVAVGAFYRVFGQTYPFHTGRPRRVRPIRPERLTWDLTIAS